MTVQTTTEERVTAAFDPPMSAMQRAWLDERITAALQREPARRSRRRLPLIRVAVFAATTVLLAGVAVGVAAQLADDRAAEIAADARIRAESEQRVNAALGPLFPAGECVSAKEGLRRTRAALDAAGFGTWQVLHDADLREGGGCTTFRISLSNSPEAVEVVPRNPDAASPPVSASP